MAPAHDDSSFDARAAKQTATRIGAEELDYTVLSTRAGYDRWAAVYDEEDNPLITLEEQYLPAVLGEVGGLSVADIGCGTGRRTLPLAEAGARVTAVDYSGGMLASIMHPALMLLGIQAQFTDPETGKKTRPESAPNQVSDYVMAALRAGLTIDHLSEHAVDEAAAHRSERAAKYLGWPMLLLLRLRPGRGGTS